VKKKLISGWTFAGILRYESGRPLTVTMTNDMSGLLFNGAEGVLTVWQGHRRSPPQGPIRAPFDPQQRCCTLNAGCSIYRSRSATVRDAAPRDPHLRGFPNAVEDISMFKVTQFAEKVRWRLESPGWESD